MKTNRVPSDELHRQRSFIERLREILPNYFGHQPLYYIHTYGCQQNVSDSERMQGLLCDSGFKQTDSVDNADFVLYNTCAIRAHAEDRVYGNLGALKIYKKRNPNRIYAICGCMVQQAAVADRIKRSYPYVDLCFGTHSAYKLPEMIYNRINGSSRIFDISEDDQDIIEDMPIKRDGELKGWLPIMYGCDNFCTYCIVPYVRGRERSRAPEDIINEARQMVAAGYKEITLLGQNVNSYGKNPDFNIDFGGLLRMINDIPGDFRIRFMTSHPKDCNESLLLAMRDCEKVCKHLHLPFQAGSDRVLKAMNRRYTAERYMSLITRARELMPDICLTSDIIVGFPGETYEDFLKTVELIEKVRFSALFTFIFSSRPGTVAAKLDDPVSREEKGKWFNELLKAQENVAKENVSGYIGKTYRVICDDTGKADGFMSGHTEGNAAVEFEGEMSLLGQFVNVEITGYDGVLKGKISQSN